MVIQPYSSTRFGSRESLFNMIRILSKRFSGLNICHINAQSLNNKMDEFRFIFEESGIDVICISETWCVVETPDSFYNLRGYRLFRVDRSTNAGGVAIYVKQSIRCKMICKSEVDEKVEHLVLEMFNNNQKLLLCTVYRPKKDIDLNPLLDKLSSLTLSYSDVIIIGDMNSNILVDKNLMEDMSAIGLIIANSTEPTHFTRTASTLLDLCFVNDHSRLLLYDQLSASLFSKHDLIFITYDYQIEVQSQTISYRDFKNIDNISLETELSTTPWNQVFLMPLVDEQLNFLQQNIYYLYNKYVPIKTKNIRNEQPWFSTEIKMLIEERNQAYARWKRFKTTNLNETFKASRRKVTSKIKIAKSTFYKEKFKSALDSKKKWKEIRTMGIINDSNKAQDIVDVNKLNSNFANIPKPEANVDLYRNLFSAYTNNNVAANDIRNININSNTALNYNNSFNNNHQVPRFQFIRFTQEDVVEAFLRIKSDSVGYDGVNPKFIKIILPYILPQITHLFNMIITTSNYPSKWKHAKIIPIPKSDNDYRPIAILPYLSKVFERLIHTQMSKYIYDNNLLTDRQSGFRPKHSCISALIDVSEELRRKVDDNMVSFLVLLDHSKAFDTVEHSILCLKLRYMCNFSTTAVNLISTYLGGRSQAVHHGTDISNTCAITRGVPQGSILGPLLYSIYSNDLPSQINYCGIQMYADDVQLYISCEPSNAVDCVRKLNQDLESINKWASANGLCLNAKKSKAMVIGKAFYIPLSLPLIQIDNVTLEVVDTAKNLGMIFNKELNWSNHINAVCGKTYAMLRNLWRTQYFTPLDVRMLLAKTYLLPTLLYGCELFSNCDSSSKQKLNVTFNNITRYVFALKRIDRTSQFSKRIYDISFDNLLKFRTLLFLHKLVYTKQPQYLYAKLSFSRSNRGKRINTIRYRGLISTRHFYITSIRLWNQLPHEIQTISNAMQFKSAIYRFLK